VHAAVRRLTDGLVDWATGWSDHWSALHWLLHSTVEWGIGAVVEMALGLATPPVTVLLGAVAYVLITRRLEDRLGAGPAAVPWYRAVARAVVVAVVALVAVNLGAVAFALLAALPALGLLLGTVGLVLVGGLVLGFLVLTFPLQHRGVLRLRDQWRWVLAHRAAVLGFGAMAAVVLAVPVPFLTVATVPAAFVGGVLLHHRLSAPVPPPPPGHPTQYPPAPYPPAPHLAQYPPAQYPPAQYPPTPYPAQFPPVPYPPPPNSVVRPDSGPAGR
jgi:uncharacterized protein involved in cysteine biosynthesis